MENADLSNANVEGAIFNNARMVKTNLMNAEGLTIEQLSKVKTLFGAKLDRTIEDELKRNFPALFEEAGHVLNCKREPVPLDGYKPRPTDEPCPMYDNSKENAQEEKSIPEDEEPEPQKGREQISGN
jgi:hypothetical protein